MKKGYQSPKAEKIAFQYAESILASSITCKGGITIDYTENYGGCAEHEEIKYNPWAGENLR